MLFLTFVITFTIEYTQHYLKVFAFYKNCFFRLWELGQEEKDRGAKLGTEGTQRQGHAVAAALPATPKRLCTLATGPSTT